MGRLFAVILILAACGDNLPVVGTNTPPAGGGGPPATLGTATPRLVPAVCGTVSWTGAPVASLDADLAVAGDATRAAIVSTPRAGGPVVGFTIDRRMTMVASSNALLSDAPLSSIGLAQLGEPYVTAGVEAGAASPFVRVDRLGPDLSQPVEVAKIPGGIVAKPALLASGRIAVVPVGGDAGVTFAGFAGLLPAGQAQIATSGPVTGLTATPFAGDALVAWSTASTCSIAQLEGLAAGHLASVDTPCASPRVAADPATGTEALVYTAGDAVLLRYFANGQLARAPEVLRGQARSPRIAFDGARYWVSYLDLHGDVVAGFVDGGGNLVSTALAGTRPQPEAYELVMISGAPWVVALDASGYSAQQLCTVPAS